jgi:hypothetical protein
MDDAERTAALIEEARQITAALKVETEKIKLEMTRVLEGHDDDEFLEWWRAKRSRLIVTSPKESVYRNPPSSGATRSRRSARAFRLRGTTTKVNAHSPAQIDIRMSSESPHGWLSEVRTHVQIVVQA